LFSALEIEPERQPDWADWDKGEFDILVKKFPNDWRIYIFRAIQRCNFVNVSQDNKGAVPKKILADIAKANKLKPKNPYVDLAYIDYYKIQSYIFRLRNASSSKQIDDNIIKYTTSVISHNPSQALRYMAVSLRGSIYLDHKEYQKSINDCNEALSINSKYGGTYYDRGLAYRGNKQYKLALEDFDKALIAEKKSAVRDYSIYSIIGETYSEMKDYKNSIAYFTKSIQWEITERDDFKKKYGIDTEIVPSNILSEIYEKRGSAHFDLEDYDNALKDFNKAIDLSPEYSYTPHNSRAILYATTGKLDEAITDVNYVIALDKKFNADPIENYQLLLKIYAAKYPDRTNSKYLELFNSMLEYAPSEAAYSNRADYYERVGINEEALSDYTSAINLEPSALLYTSRGIIYGKLGNLDKAIADFNKAIKMKPTEAGAYYYRGVCYNNMDNHSRAVADFRISARLGYDEAQNTLTQLGEKW